MIDAAHQTCTQRRVGEHRAAAAAATTTAAATTAAATTNAGAAAAAALAQASAPAPPVVAPAPTAPTQWTCVIQVQIQKNLYHAGRLGAWTG